jgi:hypothetical protein
VLATLPTVVAGFCKKPAATASAADRGCIANACDRVAACGRGSLLAPTLSSAARLRAERVAVDDRCAR